jgi:hypothetical protein
MFKYIGIRGHRGAGKNTISYLLGFAIEYFISKGNSWEGFETAYESQVKRIINEPSFIEDVMFSESDFANVYFESFADNPKIMVAQLFGLPCDYAYNDWTKDAVIVNLSNFSYKLAKDKLELHASIEKLKPYKAEQLYDIVKKDSNFLNTNDVYITLRELISYFSKYVMQNAFGRSVWVKSLEVTSWETERFFSSEKTIYKILTDCKFPTEITYIKNNKGIIIKVNRFNNIKDNTNISEELENDTRFDYELNLDGNLLNPKLIEDIKCLTQEIISKND